MKGHLQVGGGCEESSRLSKEHMPRPGGKRKFFRCQEKSSLCMEHKAGTGEWSELSLGSWSKKHINQAKELDLYLIFLCYIYLFLHLIRF